MLVKQRKGNKIDFINFMEFLNINTFFLQIKEFVDIAE